MKSLAISALVLAAAAAPAPAPAPVPVPEPVPAPQVTPSPLLLLPRDTFREKVERMRKGHGGLHRHKTVAVAARPKAAMPTQLLIDTHPPEYYMTRHIDFANLPKVIYNPAYAHDKREPEPEPIHDQERWSKMWAAWPTHVLGAFDGSHPLRPKPYYAVPNPDPTPTASSTAHANANGNANGNDKRDAMLLPPPPPPFSSELGHLTTLPQVTPLVPPPPVSSLLGHITIVPDDARKPWFTTPVLLPPTPVSSLLGHVTDVPDAARNPWFTTHVMPPSPVSSLLGTVTIVPDGARKAWTTTVSLPADPMMTLFAANDDDNHDGQDDAARDAPARRAVEADVDIAGYANHITIVPRHMGKPITTVSIPPSYWTLLPEDLGAPHSVVPVYAAEATPAPEAVHAESEDDEDLKRYPSIDP